MAQHISLAYQGQPLPLATCFRLLRPRVHTARECPHLYVPGPDTHLMAVIYSRSQPFITRPRYSIPCTTVNAAPNLSRPWMLWVCIQRILHFTTCVSNASAICQAEKPSKTTTCRPTGKGKPLSAQSTVVIRMTMID